MNETPPTPEPQPDEPTYLNPEEISGEQPTGSVETEEPTTETGVEIGDESPEEPTINEELDTSEHEEVTDDSEPATTEITETILEDEQVGPDSEERTWASIAHLSILVNLFTAVLGPLIAIIIYLIYKDKSRYIAYQAMQAFLFQMIFWVAAGLLAGLAWAASILLMIVIIGFCLMPIAILLSLVPIAALVYGVIGAIETSQGKDFNYWLVGDWARGILPED